MKTNLYPFYIREEVIKAIREFFYRKKFHEVVIPVFNIALPLEPNIYAFETVWRLPKDEKKFYLPTSTESSLKKMIAKGMGNCFAISKTFRNLEGSGKWHHPEFLMLEWYRENTTYHDIMEETQELILFVVRHSRESGNPFRFKNEWIPNQVGDDNISWPRTSMEDLFKKYANINLEEFCHAELTSSVIPNLFRDPIGTLKPIRQAQDPEYIEGQVQGDKRRSVRDEYNVKGATWEQIFNQIFLNEVEPHLPKTPFFLTDYPSRISPLCAKRKDKPYLAERFDLYMEGIEIANGNTENTNASEVLEAMKNEERYRKDKGLFSPPIDMEFIEALKMMKGKTWAGAGLGVDRLSMLVAGCKDINDLR